VPALGHTIECFSTNALELKRFRKMGGYTQTTIPPVPLTALQGFDGDERPIDINGTPLSS